MILYSIIKLYLIIYIMRYNIIRKNSIIILYIFIILLTISNLYNLFINNEYIYIVIFFLLSYLLYYLKIYKLLNLCNNNFIIIFSISLIFTKIINYFIKLFNFKLIEGFSNNDIIGLKMKLNVYTLEPKYNNDVAVNNTAINLLLKVNGNKNYSSDKKLMNFADLLYEQLNILYVEYENNVSSYQIKYNIVITINNLLEEIKNVDNSQKKTKPKTPSSSGSGKTYPPQPVPPKSIPIPPKPVEVPEKLNPICDNIMDTKLCCDTKSNQNWQELTGACNIK